MSTSHSLVQGNLRGETGFTPSDDYTLITWIRYRSMWVREEFRRAILTSAQSWVMPSRSE